MGSLVLANVFVLLLDFSLKITMTTIYISDLTLIVYIQVKITIILMLVLEISYSKLQHYALSSISALVNHFITLDLPLFLYYSASFILFI